MRCPHFGLCGGCSFQDLSYEQQLQNKQTLIQEAMNLAGIDVPLKPINHFSQWFYRNKMEFGFDWHDLGVCGLYRRGGHNHVQDIEECLIFSPDAKLILAAVKKFAKEKKYKGYDKFRWEGFLRHLILRQTKFTDQLMIGLVTTSQDQLDVQGFLASLNDLRLTSAISSVWHIINDSKSDAVVFEKKNLLYGNEFIQEDLDGLRFNIGIDSFFQVNPAGIKVLYKKICEYAQLDSSQNVLDLCCGVGSIGIFLAKTAKYVWGVEISEAIVQAAWQNAKLNQISNISFFAQDLRIFLNTQGQFYQDIDLLVLNPPRSGISAKAIRGVLRLNPKKIIYSSCNPKTLFADLKLLAQSYKPRFCEPFDFFPHTSHCEVLTVLDRVNS